MSKDVDEEISILPDLGAEGFRVRIDHYLSANLGREDLAWGMILQYIREQCPWQGVFHEDMLPRQLEIIRKHFDEKLWKNYIERNQAALLAFKNVPHRQTHQLPATPDKQTPVSVFVPESFWQFEFVDKSWLKDWSNQ